MKFSGTISNQTSHRRPTGWSFDDDDGASSGGGDDSCSCLHGTSAGSRSGAWHFAFATEPLILVFGVIFEMTFLGSRVVAGWRLGLTDGNVE